MRKVLILGSIIVLWLILVSFGFLRVYTAHDEENNKVLWYEVCLEHTKGANCFEIPKTLMDLLRIIGVRHSDSTISWVSDDPFGLNAESR